MLYVKSLLNLQVTTEKMMQDSWRRTRTANQDTVNALHPVDMKMAVTGMEISRTFNPMAPWSLMNPGLFAKTVTLAAFSTTREVREVDQFKDDQKHMWSSFCLKSVLWAEDFNPPYLSTPTIICMRT